MLKKYPNGLIHKNTSLIKRMSPIHIVLIAICFFYKTETFGQNYQGPNNTISVDETEGNSLDPQKLKVMAARDIEIKNLLDKAIAQYRHKHLQEAIELFNQVVRLDPQNASAQFSLGIALEANGAFNEAADHYQQSLALEPNNNDYQIAAESIKKKITQQNAISFEQSKWQVLASQAGQAFKQGQYEQALLLYRELDKQNPDQALTKYNIGTIYLSIKKPLDALSYYKEAHKLEPANNRYEESLKKLELSIKEVEKKKSVEEANQKNLLVYFGLKVNSSKEGVVIKEITPGSRAAQVGLQPGDIIKIIDGLSVNKSAQIEKMIKSKPLGQRFQLLVLRNGRTGIILF